MALRWRMLWGMLAALVIAVPALGQDQGATPPPYPSDPTYPERAEGNLPAEQIARETAAADAAEAACKAGDAAGCAALGSAYVLGEGRPQVRKIGEIILRRACTAGSGKACEDLAQLLLSREDTAAAEEAKGLVDRACQLGAPEGCEWPRPTPAMLERRAKGACDSGKGEACRDLAAMLLGEGRPPRDRMRGLAVLDRQCRTKDPLACAAAAEALRAGQPEDAARAGEYIALGCTAGDAAACNALGKLAMAKSPSDKAEARRHFEVACEGSGQRDACANAADLREEPGLTEACAGGDQRACVTLGLMLYRYDSVLLDRERSITLLSAACEAGALDACRPAAEYIRYGSSEPDTDVKAKAALALLTRGCDGGLAAACEALADGLEDGGFLPRDLDRALALYVPQCDAGRTFACDALVENNHPAAPPPLAKDFDPPVQTPEEVAAAQAAEEAAREADQAAFEAYRCKTATAEFEGVSYSDTMCLNIGRSIGGFAIAKIEQAPWQALIWRPAKLGTMDVAPEYRAECGGSVIASGWVLTAAHCLVDHVDGVGKFPIEKSGYRFRLGVIRPLEPEGNSYPILKVIPHPLFKRKTLEFDIALVQYDVKAGTRGQTGFATARIKLDTRSLAERPVVARTPVFSFGWGRTALDRPQAADVLQGVRLELRSATECTAATGWTDVRRDAVLCAAGAKGEQACFGDSGGPLITYGDEKGVPVQIGVVSGGIKCGTTGKPSRYTRIGHPLVQAWLASHVPGFRSGQTAR